MTNKLYVDVTFSYFETKSGYESIKTSINVTGKKKGDASKKVELKLKPAKPLHNSTYIKENYNEKANFYFKLKNDRQNNRIWLIIKDLNGIVVEDETTGVGIYWDYYDIEKALNDKIKRLAFIKCAVDKEEEDNCRIRYLYLKYYYDTNLMLFLKLLEENVIFMDFRMGTYQSGKKMGQPHDHGSGFRIRNDFIGFLYNHSICIG